jgi:hypothetical protein
MAKVFDGGKFLESHSCTVKLSNGLSVTVSELSDKTLELLDKLGDENSSVKDIRVTLAEALNVEPQALEKVQIVEMRGALDFLSKSLFE